MDRRQDREADPDRETLARVAAGDAESFGVLVERHQTRLLRLCERMLQDREAARDAAQDVFLKVFRKAASFRPRGKVSTWIYRIAVNHCLNRLRRRRIVRFLSFGELGGAPGARTPGADAADADGPVFDPEDDAPDAFARLETRRRWQRTRALIETLPPSQRAVLVLARFEGLSYREIANVLDITEGAVESRLFRAMQTLRRAQERAG